MTITEFVEELAQATTESRTRWRFAGASGRGLRTDRAENADADCPVSFVARSRGWTEAERVDAFVNPVVARGIGR
jgi:hypothetical protein